MDIMDIFAGFDSFELEPLALLQQDHRDTTSLPFRTRKDYNAQLSQDEIRGKRLPSEREAAVDLMQFCDESSVLRLKSIRPAHQSTSRPWSTTGSLVDDMSFISRYPLDNASISFTNESGDVESLYGLNQSIIAAQCPLLAEAFEGGRSGPRLHLEALTSMSARPLVRFLYTSTYAMHPVDDVFEDVPTSVLLHCQLFYLGDVYSLPMLKRQAYVNILRQFEFACCSPEQPIDLCKSIRYIYDRLEAHSDPSPKDLVLNYCVSEFVRHKLNEDAEFLRLSYELRNFRRDLQQQSMKGASYHPNFQAILQMPYKPYPISWTDRSENLPLEFCDCVKEEGNTNLLKRARTAAFPPVIDGVGNPLRAKRGESVVDIPVAVRPHTDSSRADSDCKQESCTETEPLHEPISISRPTLGKMPLRMSRLPIYSTGDSEVGSSIDPVSIPSHFLRHESPSYEDAGNFLRQMRPTKRPKPTWSSTGVVAELQHLRTKEEEQAGPSTASPETSTDDLSQTRICKSSLSAKESLTSDVEPFTASSSPSARSSPETEFEIILGPPPVEDIESDTESQASTMVVVDDADAVFSKNEGPQTLPSRSNDNTAKSPITDAASDSSADSDWDLL